MTTLIDRQTSGVYIIAATPFTDDGSVDFDSIDRLVDFYVEKGVDGMTILGMMGEADKLSAEERHAVLDRFMKRAGDLPVVVGVSDAGIANLACLTRAAMDMGAAGVMVAPTRGPAREDRVVGYFHQVCDAIGENVPVVFQDFPQATGVPVSARTIIELSRDRPQIVMLKHEDCPGLAKISAVRASQKDGYPRMSILCGNGALYLPQEMARGADGAMTGFAYPEALVGTVERFLAGRKDEAEDFFDAYLPILRHEQQPGFGLALRKTILMKRGAIASAATRAPGPRLSRTDWNELERLVARTERNLARLGL
ncbi:dihydrodipicolinate synthase family protein [Rhizobiaceae bacterium BDR2-2]|uniref:Dihydrodipicolinate synthase family protein n=1 Tax=Ectorhizobium quercum TaxID=2965071 RepID=A0AAE3N1R9_9HYPH|nr:dihydrodipicolinate synthase family protein [Ectorhizobium quercum]MCX8998367.1 dihydrodipicolinate synthase family protein [Ectorhizobium quercum]